MKLSLTVNGAAVTRAIDARQNLVDFLREALQLTGTHVGCEHGVCGACTVRVDGKLVRGCLMLAAQAEGSRVETIEGLAERGALTALQRAFRAENALQCGFCTPGMLITLTEFLRDNPNPTEQEVRIAISGNLCRCTGYQGIVLAALDAAKRLQGQPAQTP
jgi:aerobic carbon-monoxide dehydrogenase small subunit